MKNHILIIGIILTYCNNTTNVNYNTNAIVGNWKCDSLIVLSNYNNFEKTYNKSSQFVSHSSIDTTKNLIIFSSKIPYLFSFKDNTLLTTYFYRLYADSNVFVSSNVDFFDSINYSTDSIVLRLKIDNDTIFADSSPVSINYEPLVPQCYTASFEDSYFLPQQLHYAIQNNNLVLSSNSFYCYGIFNTTDTIIVYKIIYYLTKAENLFSEYNLETKAQFETGLNKKLVYQDKIDTIPLSYINFDSLISDKWYNIEKQHFYIYHYESLNFNINTLCYQIEKDVSIDSLSIQRDNDLIRVKIFNNTQEEMYYIMSENPVNNIIIDPEDSSNVSYNTIGISKNDDTLSVYSKWHMDIIHSQNSSWASYYCSKFVK